MSDDRTPADRTADDRTPADTAQEDVMSPDDTTGTYPQDTLSTGSSSTGTSTGPDPWQDAVAAPAPVLRGPALGTLLWGFVVLAVAGLVGAWEVADLRVDLSLVLPVGMVTVGVLLVVGALVTALRDRG